MAGFIFSIVLIIGVVVLIRWMIAVNNKVASGERTFFDKIAEIVFGPKR